MPPSDLGQFLTWLGSNAAIGAVISWIMANWGWFNSDKVTSGGRTAILFGVAVVMGVISRLAVTYVPAGVVADLQPYWTIILSSAIIVGGQQLWYAKVEKPKQVQTAKG